MQQSCKGCIALAYAIDGQFIADNLWYDDGVTFSRIGCFKLFIIIACAQKGL